MFPFINGFLLGGGLIIAIGAQNAFILRQGLLQQHVFLLCLVASMADAALIAAGTAGIGTLVQANPTLLWWVTIGGGIFLAVYAIMALRRAFQSGGLDASGNGGLSLKAALLTLLAFTFLNPHVYLDTVVLVGGISGQYAGNERLLFTIGAMAASFVWFFALGYGAKQLVPVFRKPRAWQILDLLIAAVMAFLSFSLFWRAFSSGLPA
ncbi:MAG: LysE/ArgO family amino acid transporter [Pseudomonadota bacterium]